MFPQIDSLLDHSIVKIRIYIYVRIDTFKIIHPKSSFCGDEYMAVDLEGVDNNFGECVIEEPLMNTSRPKENKIEIRTKVFKILSYCYCSFSWFPCLFDLLVVLVQLAASCCEVSEVCRRICYVTRCFC